jgi:hypothetical protein
MFGTVHGKNRHTLGGNSIFIALAIQHHHYQFPQLLYVFLLEYQLGPFLSHLLISLKGQSHESFHLWFRHPKSGDYYPKAHSSVWPFAGGSDPTAWPLSSGTNPLKCSLPPPGIRSCGSGHAHNHVCPLSCMHISRHACKQLSMLVCI